MPDLSDGAEASLVSAERAKAALRTAVLARRRALTAQARAAADGRIRAHLEELVRHRRPHLVAGYVPLGDEPGGSELADCLVAALAGHGQLLLPVLRADLDLDWALYRGPGDLVRTDRGLREPGGEPLGTAAISRAELVVVPALAVDRSGVRLGRGGGSYDRALTRVGPTVLTVALLYDGELLAEIPARPHDRPVRAVVMPGDGFRTVPHG